MSRAEYQWHPEAAVAAWLLPGLGHWLLGEGRRGLVIGLTIFSLWLGGLLIGGLDVINRNAHAAWFIGQALTAPSILADGIRLRMAPPIRPPLNGQSNTYQPSFGHVKDQGMLYTALAGLLNLLAILDVVCREPTHRGRKRMRTPSGRAEVIQ